MTTRHTISHATHLFVGNAQYNRAHGAMRGLPMTPLFVHNFGAPEAADADGVCASQSAAGAGDLLINGALASDGVATFDVPRNVVITSGGDDSGITFTVYGTDLYGAPMAETLTGGNAGAAAGAKAFKTVSRVAASGASASTVTVGSGDVLGLPYRVGPNGLLAARANNAVDAGTFVPAVATDPATGTTGDVRGTFDPAVTLNGSNTVQVLIQIHDISTKVGAYGVDQFAG